MAESAELVSAFGRLWPEGPWVGTRRGASGWDLVFGEADGALRAWPAEDSVSERVLLIAAAAAHFADVLSDPPVLLEATQADLAGARGGPARGAGGAAMGAGGAAGGAIGAGGAAGGGLAMPTLNLPPSAWNACQLAQPIRRPPAALRIRPMIHVPP